MSDQKLAKLALAALLAAAIALGVSYLTNRPVERGSLEETPLIQGLDTQQIARIELGDPGKDAVTLTRQGDGFVVTNHDNYPCKMDKINSLLADCLELKINRLVTSNAANHAELGVVEAKAGEKPADGAEGKPPRNVVRFFDKDNALITGVIIGGRDEKGGSYVRRLGRDEAESNRVYLALTSPWLQMSALSYVEKRLFLIEKKDIEKVEVVRPAGGYTLVAEGDKVVLQGIPAGQQAKGTAYEQVFTAVNSLEMNEVMPETRLPEGLVFDSKYIITLKDKTVVTFDLGVVGDKLYVKCASVYTGEKVSIDPNKQDSEEELKAKEARLEIMKASDEYNIRHKGWVYEIASWQKDNLLKKLEDLVEAIPQPQAPAAEQTAEGGVTPPVSIPAPVVEPVSAPEPAPAAEPVPAVEPASAPEPAPVVEPAPVAGPAGPDPNSPK